MGMDVFGRNPSDEAGRYFRASIWSWPPLHEQICRLCGDLLNDEVLYRIGFNEGAGPKDQATCTLMADRIESALLSQPSGFTSSVETELVTEDGYVISREDFARNPNLKVRPRFRIRGEHVQEWIAFLRHCGGFEVW